ncbi:MAG: NAD(P)/FAD-dependent oxidoreductase [Deltaproteobacteria bacterium]|nr:NAD(P)/FAD-dependent oxidoreductase [Deltaproteobacteria bacterium]
MKIDVVIIGAGPAGSSCAYELSKRGIGNILIERKEKPGTPVQCAEFIPLNINQYIDLTYKPEAICQNVEYMEVDTVKENYKFDGKGYILNRDIFDYYIAELAAGKGTKLLTDTFAETIIESENKLIVRTKTDNNNRIEINYKYLVLASGAKDFIYFKDKHKLICNKSYIYGIQIRTNLLKRLNSALIYFRNYIPYGYGWVFPKLNFANVGIGIEKNINNNINLRKAFDIFLNEIKNKGIISGKIISKTSGLVPISALNDAIYGNIAYCGDAAGLTHPITGAGNLSAVISGTLLGDFIYESLKTGSNLLEDYKEELFSIFYKPLSKAKAKRNNFYTKRYEEFSADELDDVVKKSWPSFNDYHSA